MNFVTAFAPFSKVSNDNTDDNQTFTTMERMP